MYLGAHPAVCQAQKLHLGWFIKNCQLCSSALRTTGTEWPYVKPFFLSWKTVWLFTNFLYPYHTLELSRRVLAHEGKKKPHEMAHSNNIIGQNWFLHFGNITWTLLMKRSLEWTSLQSAWLPLVHPDHVNERLASFCGSEKYSSSPHSGELSGSDY